MVNKNPIPPRNPPAPWNVMVWNIWVVNLIFFVKDIMLVTTSSKEEYDKTDLQGKRTAHQISTKRLRGQRRTCISVIGIR